ncbi:MAG: DUF1566 domain-containing protein [Nitrospirales bacterium]|nr:DUF1566 domain-containing protein [Nitrospirales bacterium]
MVISKCFLLGLLGIAFLLCAVGLVLVPLSQANDEKARNALTNVLEKRFPLCGRGTQDQRFVASSEHPNEVCDNNTGLWWQQTPGDPPDAHCGNLSPCTWQQAIDYCTNLALNGKTWRLAEVGEYLGLVDYTVPNQAAALNTGPFTDVLPGIFWSVEIVDLPQFAWWVDFSFGVVNLQDKDDNLPPHLAWCVNGGQDAD